MSERKDRIKLGSIGEEKGGGSLKKQWTKSQASHLSVWLNSILRVVEKQTDGEKDK